MSNVQFNPQIASLFTTTGDLLSSLGNGSAAQQQAPPPAAAPLQGDGFGGTQNMSNAIAQVLKGLDGLLQDMMSGNSINPLGAASNASSPTSAADSGNGAPTSAGSSANGSSPSDSSSGNSLLTLLRDIEQLLEQLLGQGYSGGADGSDGSDGLGSDGCGSGSGSGTASGSDGTGASDGAACNSSAASSPTAYNGLIDQAAKKYDLNPALIKAVIKNESGFNPNATSSTGAQGLMQLEPGTAAGLGVKNAYDPAQNIDGGAHLLHDLLGQFHGNVADAVAAYNAGAGAVEKYGGIPPYAETQAYVPKVLESYREYAQGLA